MPRCTFYIRPPALPSICQDGRGGRLRSRALPRHAAIWQRAGGQCTLTQPTNPHRQPNCLFPAGHLASPLPGTVFFLPLLLAAAGQCLRGPRWCHACLPACTCIHATAPAALATSSSPLRLPPSSPSWPPVPSALPPPPRQCVPPPPAAGSHGNGAACARRQAWLGMGAPTLWATSHTCCAGTCL